MKYFDHDVEAYKDDKISLLRRACTGAAVDAYYAILEGIYRNECAFQTTGDPIGFESLAMFLQTTTEQLQEWIDGMLKYGLLEQAEDGSLMSVRAADNIQRYQERCEANRENAAKRGRGSKVPDSANVSNQTNRSGSDSQPNQTEAEANRPKKEKEKEKEKRKERGGTKQIVHPTRDQALAYKEEAGLDLVDVDLFMNHYESVGWKQKQGQPIKDWRAAMRNWQIREKKYQNNRQVIPKGASPLASKYGSAW